MTYDQIAMSVAVAILLAGFVLELLLGRLRLRGYTRIARDIRAVVAALHGETDRDSGDLLIRGGVGALPVLIRISHSDQRPGLGIRLPAARGVSLFCIPKGHDMEAGRVSLRSPDPRFEMRFRLSSNHPAEARMLFLDPSTFAEIQRLCSASSSFLALNDESVEFGELSIPEEDFSRRVLECIRALAKIATASTQMPGAKPPKVARFARRWNWLRTAYVAAPIVLLSSVMLLARLQQTVEAPPPAPRPAGIADNELGQIPDVQHWRLAQPADFDPDATAWLQQQGQQLTAHIRGGFATGESEDSAYILKPMSATTGSPSRLVVFLKGQLRFDANMPEIAIGARIPKERLGSVDWRGRRPAGQPDGDGILIVQKYKDASSAIVLFSSGVQLATGNPTDFHSISLE